MFAIVLECIPYRLAQLITKKLDIPTIGIGAGPFCDGQVLVSHDIFGMFPGIERKHSRTYINAGEMIKKAARQYVEDVQQGIFPTEKNSFIIDEEVIAKLEKEF